MRSLRAPTAPDPRLAYSLSLFRARVSESARNFAISATYQRLIVSAVRPFELIPRTREHLIPPSSRDTDDFPNLPVIKAGCPVLKCQSEGLCVGVAACLHRSSSSSWSVLSGQVPTSKPNPWLS